MKNKLEQFIQARGIKLTEAATLLSVSRQTIANNLKGELTAQMEEKIDAVELNMNNQEICECANRLAVLTGGR
jgi:plasmid maintenance system antidote protein VapI